MDFTLVGTILTGIGTAVTLWQASKVKKYSDKIAFDIRKLHLSEVSEHLKKAQDDGRKLLSHMQQMSRGKNTVPICSSIQTHIDNSLNLLHLNSPDADVREKILNIQSELRKFQNTTDDNEKKECVSDMHTFI